MKKYLFLVVRVIPRAKQNSVTEKNGEFVVHVTAPADEGRANEMVIKVLAEHFGVSRSGIAIKRGLTARHKIIQISGI